MKNKSLNIGWKFKIMLKRAIFSISINKMVAIGCGLEKGNFVYFYLEKDNERPIMVVYLDGKSKNERIK